MGSEISFKKGEEVILTNEESAQKRCDRSLLYVTSAYFLEQAEVGNTIFVGDGLLSLIVKEKRK